MELFYNRMVALNAGWSIYDAVIGAYAQSALFGIYLVLSIGGIYEWKGAEKAH